MLADGYREIRVHHGSKWPLAWRQGEKAGSLHLQMPVRSRKNKQDRQYRWGFQLSKPDCSDTLPPARLHFLNLSEQSHQLGTKYSNIRACKEGILIQTTISGKTKLGHRVEIDSSASVLKWHAGSKGSGSPESHPNAWDGCVVLNCLLWDSKKGSLKSGDQNKPDPR